MYDKETRIRLLASKTPDYQSLNEAILADFRLVRSLLLSAIAAEDDWSDNMLWDMRYGVLTGRTELAGKAIAERVSEMIERTAQEAIGDWIVEHDGIEDEMEAIMEVMEMAPCSL